MNLMNIFGLRNSRLNHTKRLIKRSFSAEYSHVVIGGGVVGLAIAAELSKVKSTRVILFEKNNRIGMETSSHNSEVIHAGLYYPPDSLKSKLCIMGKQIIYNEMDRTKTGVNWINCGKWIVAQNDYEDSVLEELCRKCRNELGVRVEMLTSLEAKRKERFIRAERSVLNSPTTGIIDSHSLMAYLLASIENNDGEVVLGSEVVNLKYVPSSGYVVTVRDHFSDNQDLLEIATENLINSSGLYADRISNMLLPLNRHVKQYYAKGNYFKLVSGGFPPVRRLIYPVPPKNGKSLGTHLTIDMDYQIKFGPDLEYVESPSDYTVSDSNIPAARKAINRYYPYIEPNDIVASDCGIRPKLAGRGGKGFKDFYIKQEEDFPGFINLLGIESPGLTSSIAIGRYVKDNYFA